MNKQPKYLMEAGRSDAERVKDKTEIPWTQSLFGRMGLVPLSDESAPMKALEVGCGPGTTSDCMQEFLGNRARVVGVDMSAERLVYAHEHYPDVTFVEAAAEELPFCDGSFDFTFSRFLFEYLQEPPAALKEMIRVTRWGGIVAVGDLDLNCTAHFGMDPDLTEMVDAIDQYARTAKVFNSRMGAELFPLFNAQSEHLSDIQHHCEIYHHFAGPIPADHNLRNWEAKLKTLAPVGAAALGGTRQYAEFARRMTEFLSSEKTLTYSVFHLVWARRI